MTPNTVCSLLIGIGLGVGAMYYSDPRNGRRRRALLRDKMNSMASSAREYATKKSKHVANKAKGLAHDAESAVQSAAETVGSKIKKAASSAGASVQ